MKHIHIMHDPTFSQKWVLEVPSNLLSLYLRVLVPILFKLSSWWHWFNNGSVFQRFL